MAFAPDDQDVADMLYGGRFDLVTNCFQQFSAFIALCALNTDFNQFMCLKGAPDFSDDAGSQTISSDSDDWIQMMGLRTQSPALCGTKFYHGILNCNKVWILL